MLCGRPDSPAPRALWESLVRSDPLALPYQTPSWLEAICAGGQYLDVSRAYRFTDGTTAVLPMVRRRGPERLVPASSLPDAWGIGGLVCSDPPSPAHIDAVVADLRQLPYLHVRLRPNPMRADVWADATAGRLMSEPRLVHVLDLQGGIDVVWKQRYTKSTRAGIRFAERAGIDVECGNNTRLVEQFYSVLEGSVQRWAEGNTNR